VGAEAPIQGRSALIPVRQDLPSTSRGIPTMIFTGRGNVGEAPIHKGIRIKENIQIVPPRGAWRPQLVSLF